MAELLNDTWEISNRHGLLRKHEPTESSTLRTPIDDFIRDDLLPPLTSPPP
jgi:hypothetical protein